MLAFLSHLSGDEGTEGKAYRSPVFLSHLSGDEDEPEKNGRKVVFLSHLSGDEEELYLKKFSYSKAWKAKYPNLPSNFHIVITVCFYCKFLNRLKKRVFIPN